MKGASTIGVRRGRPPKTDALQKEWPPGTEVWFYRETVAGLAVVRATIEAHDKENTEWLVRTRTGRNVRIHPRDLYKGQCND